MAFTPARGQKSQTVYSKIGSKSAMGGTKVDMKSFIHNDPKNSRIQKIVPQASIALPATYSEGNMFDRLIDSVMPAPSQGIAQQQQMAAASEAMALPNHFGATISFGSKSGSKQQKKSAGSGKTVAKKGAAQEDDSIFGKIGREFGKALKDGFKDNGTAIFNESELDEFNKKTMKEMGKKLKKPGFMAMTITDLNGNQNTATQVREDYWDQSLGAAQVFAATNEQEKISSKVQMA